MSGLTGHTSAPYLEHLSHAGLAEVERSVGQAYHPKLLDIVARLRPTFVALDPSTATDQASRSSSSWLGRIAWTR
jgi:hypothetical protein